MLVASALLPRPRQAGADQIVFKAISDAADPTTQRRMLRAGETGTWLTTMPICLNGTELSADEFRDSLRLRLGLVPLGIPDRCDGCGQRFSLGHAMTCKKGGLVLLRHNDVAAEWHHLCAQALSPSAVSNKPLIHSSRGGNGRAAAQGAEAPPDICGDVAVHGFWRRGATAIFDIRVTDTDAPYHRGQAPHKILAKQEREKKISTSMPVWLGAVPLLRSSFRWTACEAVRQAQLQSGLPLASQRSGSGRTAKYVASSAPASRSRSFGRRACA